MTSLLPKDETIDLFSDFEKPLLNFSLAVTWDSAEIYIRNFLGIKKKLTDFIELDFTCVMFDKYNKMIDSICSPKYNSWLIHNNFPLGKSYSKDGAFEHFDYESKNDPRYKKVISIDLARINNETETIFFYLNFDLKKIKSPSFSSISSLQLMIFDDNTLKNIFSEHYISTESSSQKIGIFVLGKLYREANHWKFKSIRKTINEKTFVKLTTGY
ncbi:TerD family protein [Chryseobacterium sp. JAH]|uniref:TerD family protein n=1 Tax=Chryseobacterium sp. JAH TaxID=1742858 RepID=UPI0007413CD6|nr:TerD family protein [Chryseobacterium sp. JAH]KUJ53227.1 hypothetical protein AR685_02220 [Chryseobacterium sp. JAH]